MLSRVVSGATTGASLTGSADSAVPTGSSVAGRAGSLQARVARLVGAPVVALSAACGEPDVEFATRHALLGVELRVTTARCAEAPAVTGQVSAILNYESNDRPVNTPIAFPISLQQDGVEQVAVNTELNARRDRFSPFYVRAAQLTYATAECPDGVAVFEDRIRPGKASKALVGCKTDEAKRSLVNVEDGLSAEAACKEVHPFTHVARRYNSGDVAECSYHVNTAAETTTRLLRVESAGVDRFNWLTVRAKASCADSPPPSDSNVGVPVRVEALDAGAPDGAIQP